MKAVAFILGVFHTSPLSACALSKQQRREAQSTAIKSANIIQTYVLWSASQRALTKSEGFHML